LYSSNRAKSLPSCRFRTALTESRYMILQVIFGALLSVIGFLAGGLGVVFLIASHGLQSRLFAGGTMLAGGLALIVIGIFLFRRGTGYSPAGIRKELIRLARMNNGELTREAIAGSLGTSDTVNFEVAALIKEGVAVERTRDNRSYYIFEDFRLAMVVKKCPYCGNDYLVRDDIEKCPSCGGDLKMERTALAKNGGKYSMDEEDDSGVS
jgi:hypothetical protein